MQNAILNSALALAAVLLLVLAAAWAARQGRPNRPPGSLRLQLQGTLPLDPRRQLHIVACDGRCVLLLTGPQDLVVGWLPERLP